MEALKTENAEFSLRDAYDEFFPKMYNFIYFRILSKEHTEDLVSEIFLKVAKSYGNFDPAKASLKTWIYTIANNTLIDYYRQRKETVSLDAADAPVLSSNSDEQLELIRSEERKALYIALKGLDERTRIIISLKYFAEKSTREIAKELQMNESSVSTLHVRGLKKLKRLLGENIFKN